MMPVVALIIVGVVCWVLAIADAGRDPEGWS